MADPRNGGPKSLQTRLPPEPFPPLPRADFAQPSRRPTVGNSTYYKNVSESSTSAIEGRSTDQQINTTVPDWALVASTSTPSTRTNRFAVSSVDESDDEEQQYVDPSRRTPKRPRVRSTEQQSQQAQARSQQTPITVAESRRPPTMFGKLTVTSKVSAAGKWGKKSVFCVHNVSTNCSAVR